MAAPKTGTRQRLLDAAEVLFAERGYHGASTRAIVAASDDNIASVNYHFGSKAALLDAVIRRKFQQVVEARRAAYAAAIERSGRPTIEDVVDSIVRPYLELAFYGGDSWKSYVNVLHQVVANAESYDETLRLISEPAAEEFFGWMRDALPDASDEDIGYSYQFMIGSMVENAVESGIDRISRISKGACSPGDFKAMSTRLIRFISAGVIAVCKH